MSPMKASFEKNNGCFHYIIKRIRGQDVFGFMPSEADEFENIGTINWDLAGRCRIYQRTESVELVSLPLGEGVTVSVTDEAYCT